MNEKNVSQVTQNKRSSEQELIDAFIALNAMLHTMSSMLSAQTRVALSDLVAYEHIRLYGPLSAKDVAHRVQMGSGATTALIDRLERRGYIKRVPHATDRRSVMITAVNRDTLSVPRLDAFLDRVTTRISSLTPPERRVISDFFAGVTEDGLDVLK